MAEEQQVIKDFVCILNQTGDQVPEMTILKNDFGGDFYMSKDMEGRFYLNNPSNPFVLGRTTAFINNRNDDGAIETTINVDTTTTADIRTILSGVASDGLLTNCSVKITYYS